MSSSRLERLAILRDRHERGAPEPGDLAEALSLATEAHREAHEAQRRLVEMEGLRSLMSAADAAIRNSAVALGEVEKHLSELAQARGRTARFYSALSTPKVIVPVSILALLILGSLIGALTIEPVRLPTSLLGPP